MKKILVTGGAGFIGSHLVDSLLADQFDVLVIDNFDPFYDRRIKEQNIINHRKHERYHLIEADIRDRSRIFEIFHEWRPEIVVHLAAKAGVRPSVQDPQTYIEVNINGTVNVLDASVKYGVKKFIFGSSSSVYGLNKKVPFSEEDPLLKPASPYGATKLAGEAICSSYSNCYGLPIIALRFFTVYGPRQRPDLAIHKFTRKILNGEPIHLYGDGTSSRDYTYIDDIVEGIRRAMDYMTTTYEVINLGNNETVGLLEMVRALEEILGVKARLQFLPPQTGDVPKTWADVKKVKKLLGFRPQTPFREGLKRFVEWFMTYASKA